MVIAPPFFTSIYRQEINAYSLGLFEANGDPSHLIEDEAQGTVEEVRVGGFNTVLDLS